ncbi:hypothetical protein PVK06_030663 [Gossypium arboreum]|uniref:Uncharacterized protein n=1 Tax=Gossypium arboreum TaxID=29729 RepID=A0ABR0NNW1_GOSAR|nr:hypothetical protein PVK06_030663 [Gossypium arboreum]
MSIDDINASFNLISLDHIFEDVDPLSEWLREKENLLLDGENVGVSTPSHSGNGPDGGGLSPIDEDDGYSGDRGEIRSSSQYKGEYGVGTTSGHFRDRSEFDGNMFPEPRRDRSEPKAPSKGKGKKHISIGSSSGRKSSFSNLGYSDSSTSTQGFYPPEQPSYFQPSHGYPQPYGHRFLIMHRMFISSPSLKLLRNIEDISQVRIWQGLKWLKKTTNGDTKSSATTRSSKEEDEEKDTKEKSE